MTACIMILGILSLGLVSCEQKVQQAPPPPPPVTVGKPTIQTIRDYRIFTGSSRAIESAEVVARVSGNLETVEFEPTTEVKKGDLLFTIEKTKYQAAFDSASAAVKSAEADLHRAEAELKRMKQAIKTDAVSELDVERAQADRDMAEAKVLSAKAALEDAKLNLSYTRIVSPIDGVVSRNLVDAGNVVGKDGSTLLTRVNKLQPIYVYFNAPESFVLEVLEIRRQRVKEGKEKGRNEAEATVALANDEGFPHIGVIDYIDNMVDPDTGTIEMRMRLENEEELLFPGLFVRVKVTGAKRPDAVLVPEVAVSSDLGGKYILVVGGDNIVEQRYVELGLPQEEGLIHVKKGLEGKETIIVNGLMFARPGRPVTPLTPEEMKAMQEQQKTAPKKEAKKEA
jgi:RND family efflux transporter MFP subunit